MCWTHPAVDIIVLGCFVYLAIRCLAVDHAASHWQSDGRDVIDEFWLFSIAHGVQSPF